MKVLFGIGVAVLLIGFVACQQIQDPPQTVPGGNAQRGAIAIQSYGCGACHTIGGVPGANARVGPNLHEIGNQAIIAGRLANVPDNLVNWIQHPQDIDPGNAMPDMGVTEQDARDIAAYLYSQR